MAAAIWSAASAMSRPIVPALRSVSRQTRKRGRRRPGARAPWTRDERAAQSRTAPRRSCESRRAAGARCRGSGRWAIRSRAAEVGIAGLNFGEEADGRRVRECRQARRQVIAADSAQERERVTPLANPLFLSFLHLPTFTQFAPDDFRNAHILSERALDARVELLRGQRDVDARCLIVGTERRASWWFWLLRHV